MNTAPPRSSRSREILSILAVACLAACDPSGGDIVVNIDCPEVLTCDPGRDLEIDCIPGGFQVQLDGTGSAGPDCEEIEFAWSASKPGVVFDDSTSPTPVVSVAAPECGKKIRIRLVVSLVEDPEEFAGCTMTIHVKGGVAAQSGGGGPGVGRGATPLAEGPAATTAAAAAEEGADLARGRPPRALVLGFLGLPLEDPAPRAMDLILPTRAWTPMAAPGHLTVRDAEHLERVLFEGPVVAGGRVAVEPFDGAPRLPGRLLLELRSSGGRFSQTCELWTLGAQARRPGARIGQFVLGDRPLD